MITDTSAPAMPHETPTGRARVKAGRLDYLPEWRLTRASGVTWLEATDVVLPIIRTLHGEDETPDGEGQSQGMTELTIAELEAIRVPLGRYAAARAAGRDDTAARDHAASGRWADRIHVADRTQADRTAGEDGLVWVPAGRCVRRAVIAPYVSIINLEQAGTSTRFPVLGWWCLPSVVTVLQDAP